MTSPDTYNQGGARVEVFADSFDSWIEPGQENAPQASAESAQGATNTMKWTTWAEADPTGDWPAEAVEVFATTAPARRGERLMRGAAYAVGGLVASLLLAGLLLSSVARWRRSTLPPTAVVAISMQQRLAWQKVVAQNAFDLARSQARAKGHSLSAIEKHGAAQKAVLQTVNTGGPDYRSLVSAKAAGAIDKKLWSLAISGASRGGNLPRVAVQHRAVTTVRSSARRVRVARTVRRAPEKQAVILGHGPVREATDSIILIHD
jgi:hypothetical protein